MQARGIPVIPSANWGSYDSLDYCFDGLPQGGVIAINHSVVGSDKTQRQLYRAGVEQLVATKHPDMLLVYGFELPFDPGVKTKYYESRIQKLRNYGTKKVL